jgi:acyl carrier protein
MSNNSKSLNPEQLIKGTLSELLGVEPEDLSNEDSLIDDLHMNAAVLSDFLELMKKRNIDTSKIDFTNIDTVSELIDHISSDEIFT